MYNMTACNMHSKIQTSQKKMMCDPWNFDLFTSMTDSSQWQCIEIHVCDAVAKKWCSGKRNDAAQQISSKCGGGLRVCKAWSRKGHGPVGLLGFATMQPLLHSTQLEWRPLAIGQDLAKILHFGNPVSDNIQGYLIFSPFIVLSRAKKHHNYWQHDIQ